MKKRQLLIEKVGFVDSLAYRDSKGSLFINEGVSVNINGRLSDQERKEAEKGHTFLIGIIQRADFLNENNRIYPYDVLKSAINNYMPLVKEGRALGEINHRDDEEIDHSKVSHKIVDIWWEGKEVWGKIRLTSNRVGKDVRNLIVEDNVRFGISSRAFGSLEQDSQGRNIVGDDLEFFCWDLVMFPGTKNAYIDLSSDYNYVKEGNSGRHQVNTLEKDNNKVKDILKTIL